MGANPWFYNIFSSQHGDHLGHMWSLTVLLTQKALLCFNLLKWNMVLLRSHHCLIYKSCSEQWTFPFQKALLCHIVSWEGGENHLGCFSVMSYLLLQPAWCQTEDGKLQGEQRSDLPSRNRLICTRWGVRLVPVIITWLKRLETHFPLAPVVNVFFSLCIPHLSVIWLAGGLLWPQDACCAPLHPPLSTDVLLCLNVSHIQLFFFKKKNLQLITISQTSQKQSKKKNSELFRGWVKQYSTSSFEVQSWNVSHLAACQSFVIHRGGNDTPFLSLLIKKMLKMSTYLSLSGACSVITDKGKSIFQCFQFHLLQFNLFTPIQYTFNVLVS